MIKCLMLDVDGVLVTGRVTNGAQWYSSLQADLGIDPNWLRVNFFARFWGDIVEVRADLLPILKDCLRQIDTDLTADTLIKYWFEMDARIDRKVLAACAIVRARGVKVYLATNQEHCRAHYLMDDMKLASHVSGMVYSAALGVSKPKPAFYAAAQEVVGF